MVSPLERLTQLSAALDTELIKTNLPEDEAIEKIFIRSVTETDSFEVKDTGLFASVKRFFSRLFAPQRYDLAANLVGLKHLLTQIKSEDIAALEPFIEKVEKIQNHVIHSLEDKARVKNSASLDERIKTLKDITFPHASKVATSSPEPVTTLNHDNELLFTTIKKTSESITQLDLQALKLIPQTKSTSEEITELRTELVRVCEATNILLLEIDRDPKLTKAEKTEASSSLRTGYDRLREHISKIDALLEPEPDEEEEPTSVTTLTAAAGSEHAQLGGTRHYHYGDPTQQMLQIAQIACGILLMGTTDLPTIAVTLAAPFVASFAASQISQRLPTKIAPYAAAPIQMISTLLLVRYGVSFVNGSMAYLVSTKPPATEPLALQFNNQTNIPASPQPNITVPEYIQPMQPLPMSNLTEPLPMSLLSDKPLDIPLQMTPIPQVESAVPIAQLPQQSSGGAWAWTTDKVSRIFRGYMRTYDQPAMQASVVTPQVQVEGQVFSESTSKIRNL